MKRTLLLCLIAVLGGCSGSSNMEGGATASPNASPSADASASPSASASTSATPAVDLKEVPAELQTDAYHYYGLNNTKVMSLEMTQSSGERKQSSIGTLETKFKGLEKVGPVFEIAYGGDLEAALGSNTVSLRADGIHVVSMTSGTVTGDNLELPAKLTPGTTWHSKTVIKKPEATLEQDVQFKVVGPQKIQTKASTYPDALLVIGNGTMKMNGSTTNVTLKAWYVKDRGSVRQEMSMHEKGKPDTTVIIQESKAS
jgi:hypothetical protein